MKRLFVIVVAFEVALLIVGLTWVRPIAQRDEAKAAGPAKGSASQTAFRTYGQGSGNVVEVVLDAVETEQDIAPGVTYHAWTFGGTTPAPVIRVTEGDTIRFTLNNESKLQLSHSIDFHAAQTPWDVNYVPVPPGQSLTFDWVARFPGVFMYHCGVPPVLHHIANGMYGAIIVEPKGGLPPAREYVLVSSEFYPAAKPTHGVFEGDIAAMEAADPTYVVFNGYANQYLDTPLEARPGEPIRLWVMNAGPTLDTAFHVIGALFDHVYPDGNPTNQLNGMQTWSVPPGGGAMFELSIPDAGVYPFVTHSFAYTGLGAVGTIKVSADAPAAPTTYPTMASPFDGGLTEVKGTVGGSGPAVQPGTGSTTGSTGPDGSASGDVTQLHASIAEGFTPSMLQIPEGGGTVEIVNDEAIPHDFTIDELGIKVALDANATVDVKIDAPAGTYTFYCSIPGHREAGMEGTLVVGTH
jgi:nitrite reductase (NO-forming)